MKLELSSKRNIYLAIFLYSLVFILIRFFASKYGMTYDEAEQFIDARSYVLGYSDQPPLYSWILKTVSYVFGLNVSMMILVYHAVAASFVICLFKISDLLFDSNKKSLYCFLSFILFFIYSYDFYRYTIHTALMMLFCALSFYTYLKIYLQEANWNNYFALGGFFALGLLSKYNFVFFILALVVASLFTKKTRAILFSLKTISAIAVCLLIFSPHLSWVFNNDFAPIHYALKRGDAGALKEEFNLISVLLNTYWNYLVYAAVILLFFFKDFQKKNTDFDKFLLALFAFCVLFPLALIVILKAGNFSQRWLAPLNIFIPFVFFNFIELGIKKWQYKLFKIGIGVLILVFYVMRIASYYFPDQTKPSFLSKPHQAIYSDIKKDFIENGIDIKDVNLDIYSFKELNIMAGLRSFNEELEAKVVYPQNKDLNFTNDLIIYSKDNRKAFEAFIEHNNFSYKLLFSKSAPYLHSRKGNLYKVNFALINSVE